MRATIASADGRHARDKCIPTFELLKINFVLLSVATRTGSFCTQQEKVAKLSTRLKMGQSDRDAISASPCVSNNDNNRHIDHCIPGGAATNGK